MGKQLKKRQNQPPKPPAKDFIQEPLPFEESPVLLSSADVCKLLGGISRTSLYRLEKSGGLAGCRVDLGGSVRYHRRAVIRWVDAQVKPV